MTRTFLKSLALAALVGFGALSLPATAEAGRGWGGHGHWHGGHGWRGGGWGGPGYWGAGLIGLGVGAAIGSALAAPAYVDDPYVDAPPPPPGAYAPVAAGYGPDPWSPEWYDYCAQRYRSFNARTGYFMGYDGQPHFCQ